MPIFPSKKKSAIDTETTEQYEARRDRELQLQQQQINQKYTIQPSEPTQYRKEEGGRYNGIPLEKGQSMRVEDALEKAGVR